MASYPVANRAYGVFLSIIVWECATTALLWMGVVQMVRRLRRSAAEFHASKKWALAGLTLGATIWLLAFLSVGGEWFAMWQSKTWNGQDAAFRMFCVTGIVLLVLAQREEEAQP